MNKRIKHSFILFFFFSSILFIIYYSYQLLTTHPVLLLSKNITQKKDNTETIADSYIKDAHIISYKQGYPKFDFNSSYILHYPGDTESIAHEPLLRISTQEKQTQYNSTYSAKTYSAKNRHPLYNYWTVKSKQAWLSADTTAIRMENNVLIVKNDKNSASFFQLETSILWLWPKKEYAKTNKYVKIKTNQALITAIGMTADLHTTQYHLLNDVHVKIKQ